ncbi:DUF3899 domain-containing protein [Virgibacillus sp. MSP4-1]|uniref:DUF3899 domain-containing protein n=1 Tax=Virgibacillus sp. MSP4-1 TaxID=2700081 RepID=UPI0003A8A832|nr:DUF3899 domain-containing protein [Virgibacillus sp. MSP4-1]QHS21683.1 DUF3899 domain-containing protein [Virgibacillus sp. MSP4-1]
MYIIKNKWFFLFINILITVFVYFYNVPQGHSLKYLINSLFYVSFPYIMLSLILYITRERFFDGITFGFRRFWAEMSKKDYMEEWKERPLPSEKISIRFLKALSFQALSLFILMILLIFIYYM